MKITIDLTVRQAAELASVLSLLPTLDMAEVAPEVRLAIAESLPRHQTIGQTTAIVSEALREQYQEKQS